MSHHLRRICFIDFDHTLFDTDHFFHVDVKNRFLELGIDADIWERTYPEVCRSGYTLEKHAEAICAAAQETLPLDDMQKIIREEFADLGRYLFPDVVPCLCAAKKAGVPLAILSFGNPTWQKYKVHASGIGSY